MFKQKQKSSAKLGGPAFIHHMSGCKVDMWGGGGGGLIFKYVQTKLESEFLTSQDE